MGEVSDPTPAAAQFPSIVMIGGPNGAGKTTIARAVLVETHDPATLRRIEKIAHDPPGETQDDS